MDDLATYLLGIGWIVFSILVGWYAQNKLNRRFLPWALLSCVASPIVAGIALAVVGEKPTLGSSR